MDTVKRTILLDLENQFDRKVSHKQLFSSLIYDFLFANMVIGPLYVFTWRGTWLNADLFFDHTLFHGNLKASAIFVLIFGVITSAILIFAQHEIKLFAMSCNK